VAGGQCYLFKLSRKMKLSRSNVALFLASVFGQAAVSSAAVSQQISSEHLQFFENKIRPILATNCLECHSADKGKIKGGLNLDSKPDWIKGGESGALIKEGDVKGSTLIKAVTWEDDLQMPPKKKLTDEQIEDLKQWVAMGAPDPREPSKNAAKLDKKSSLGLPTRSAARAAEGQECGLVRELHR